MVQERESSDPYSPPWIRPWTSQTKAISYKSQPQAGLTMVATEASVCGEIQCAVYWQLNFMLMSHQNYYEYVNILTNTIS